MIGKLSSIAWGACAVVADGAQEGLDGSVSRNIGWPSNAPTAAAIVLCVSAGVGWLAQSWFIGLLTFLATAAGLLVVSEIRFHRRLRKLVEEARSLLEEESVHPYLGTSSERLATLLSMQRDLEQQLKREQNLLRAEAQRRARAEDELRESEERYTLAVSGANDGMWEWTIGSGTAYFSPRWKSMLGYAESEIGDRIEEWRSRIHPEDRDSVLRELQAHLDGHTPRFEHEHRLRHKDGGWRWVLARAAAVRHASGRAYRLVGLNSDISARRQAQEVLLELADGLHGLQGERAYAALVEKFATLLDTSEAFLCECCDQPPTRARMLAHWCAGELAPCHEFDLDGLPCQEVVLTGKTVFAPHGASIRWPKETNDGIETYLGLPCFDTKGRVIGHLACRDRKPMPGQPPHGAVIKLFAVRASVEMERRVLERMQAVDPRLPTHTTPD